MYFLKIHSWDLPIFYFRNVMTTLKEVPVRHFTNDKTNNVIFYLFFQIKKILLGLFLKLVKNLFIY